MIRRTVGNEFWLIAQDDHAKLSGQLAGYLGNAHFDRPEPFEPVIQGIALHDSGWPIQDDLPTLNSEGLPLHVFEAPLEIAVTVWSRSVENALKADAYAGLLVSLHVLALSARAVSGKWKNALTARQTFELNKFQHRQIEIQQELRSRFGLRIDEPLTLGLLPAGKEPREQMLSDHFHLLQAMDEVSLAICCDSAPEDWTVPVRAGRSEKPVRLHLLREGVDLRIDPWPFGVREIPIEIAYKAVMRGPYDAVESFQRIYSAARRRTFTAKVRAA